MGILASSFLVLLFCLLPLISWGANCGAGPFYIDFTNSETTSADTNNGTGTATAWIHVPGDPDATDAANCTPIAGNIFYFKKGVTYTLAPENSITVLSSGTLVVPSVNTAGTTATITSGGVLTDLNADFTTDAVAAGDYVYIYHSKASQTDTWVASTGVWPVASQDSATQLALTGFDKKAYSTAEMTYRITRPIQYTTKSDWGTGDATLDGDTKTDYIFKPNGTSRHRISNLKLINTRWGNSTGIAVGTPNTTASIYAHKYVISAVTYSGDAVASLDPGTNVVLVDTYGAIAFDIGVDGVIHRVEAAGNEDGSYGTAAAAYQALAAPAASHVRIGHITVMKTDGAFTFGTTPLVAVTTGAPALCTNEGGTCVSFVSGTDGSTTGYCGYGSGVNPWYQPSVNVGGAIVYTPDAGSDNIYDSLTMENHWFGIYTQYQQYSVIKNCMSDNIGRIVYTPGVYGLVENNTSTDGGSVIRAAGDYAIIRNNTITDAQHSITRYCGNHSDGIGPLFGASYIWILGNTVQDTTMYIFLENPGGCPNTNIINNILIRTTAATANGEAIYMTASAGTIVEGNVIFEADANFSNAIKIANSANVSLKNNIIWGDSVSTPAVNVSDATSVDGFTASNNYYYIPNRATPFGVSGVLKSWAQWAALGYDSTGGVCCSTVPGFTSSVAPFNFYPASSSAGIVNVGASGVYAWDKDSSARSAPWDIGAYEFGINTLGVMSGGFASGGLLSQ